MKPEKFWDKQAKDFITTPKYLNIDDTVLDYGCATGIISNAISDKVKEIHAIDISSKMIEIAKTKAGERSIKNVNYAQATIFDERYLKESFNVILAFRILHMLEDTQAVIRRINELLKPGGIFISVTACMGPLKAFLGVPLFLLRKIGIMPLHINMFNLPELQGIITGGSFKIVEYERMNDRLPHYCIVARKL